MNHERFEPESQDELSFEIIRLVKDGDTPVKGFVLLTEYPDNPEDWED